MKRAIKACVRCGSQDLRFRTWWGPYTCRTCQWRGTPIEFADEASWKAFVGSLKSSK